jgi:fumarate hydratase class I
MAHRTIEHPFTPAKVRDLRVGDIVRLTGRVFTGRDLVHRHLFEGGKCPVDLRDGALYHCGPVVVRKEAGWRVLAAGPTTSMRQEPYMPRIIEQHKVRVIIGKGGMGKATVAACAKHGCVYLQAVGGAACALAGRIEKVGGVHFAKEFGWAEALWEFWVRDFPAVVAVAANGRNLFRRVETASRRALRKALGEK